MTSIEMADRRIEAYEKELARVQFEESTPVQLEANLTREALARTLTTGAEIARACMVVLDQIGDSFEDSVERMQRDLAGRD